MPAPFDLRTRRRLTTEDTIDLWVHSPSGSDYASGTIGAPLASVEEAMHQLGTNLWGRRTVIHCLDGHVENLERALVWPPLAAAGPVEDLVLDGVDPAWDYLRCQVMLQAEPPTVQNITGTIAYDSVTGLATVTVAGAGWGTNEHAGRGLINPGFPAEHGVILSNTATQLVVASLGYSDGTLRIVRRAAQFTLGDASSLGDPAGMRIMSALCSVAMVGISIIAQPGAGPALDILSPGLLALVLCEIDGGIQTRSSGNTLTVDASYIHGGFFAPNAGSVALRQCVLSGLGTAFHAVNGQYDIIGCRIDGCGAMGHGGTSTPHGGFRVDNCEITGGTGDGVKYGGGNRSRVQHTRISNCVANGINADGVGDLLVASVVGTGNGQYGCKIDNGAKIAISGSPSVTGTSGDVRLGGTTYTWGDAPQRDDTKYSRFGA